MLLLVSVPMSAFADGSTEIPSEFESQFILVEDGSVSQIDEAALADHVKSGENLNNSTVASAPVGGYGTIKCSALGSGKMSCNWSVTLTKSGEAIQSLFVIFDVKNKDGRIVGTKEESKTPLGGNKKTYSDQIDFNPGPGLFSVEKYGAVAGRTAVYNIVSVTPDYVNVY